jgi:hypothetical protein
LALAASCFAVSGKVVCIDAGYAPVNPPAPVVVAPTGPFFDTEDEDIVIRDDGGHHVARG